MPEARGEIEIERPPAEVFKFLADGENDRHWRDGVLDVKRKSGGGKGAIYEQGVKGPFGRWGSYLLEPAPGGTRLTFALSATPTGLAKLMTPMVAKTMRAEVTQLGRLKDVLER